ncbi:hypothetical protein FOJ82_12270 [Tessaracoccus rhinocerotis]|uniref:Signal transduction histidine kinase subgroup 3 dimerisation and phosphoacceptor domain-containing protein n=1 Tax=Tessaracoccus rhinocerotis TaxID=1689449 RepID=A0A553JXY7_9ACTN|nr:histidine kinase [Tessaracoccus rhinocerotis]TRY17319.1 hypothetical protein FOJ82_12270 [Tessaracoccus rhinocerotis]
MALSQAAGRPRDSRAIRAPMAATGEGPSDAPSPRLVVLGVLMACFAWAVVIPLSLSTPPTPLLAALHASGLAVYGATLLLVLWASVWVQADASATWWCAVAVVAVSLGLWFPGHAWAEPGGHPWAWVGGFTTAACAVLGWRSAAPAGITMALAAYGGSVAFERPAAAVLLTMLGCALVVWAMSQALVWLLRLLWAAQAAREAGAEIAIVQERLRVSRELHDVLGHRLSVIALKAELAAGLVGSDPARAVAENGEIQSLALGALAEARRTVRGRADTDLPTQLFNAELVLGSAGIDVRISVPPEILGGMPQPVCELMAAATREAVTNVLRHSEATQVSIQLAQTTSDVELAITNDGVRGPAAGERSHGTGLAGLAARCAALGARLDVTQDAAACHVLRVRCPCDPAGWR